MSRPPLPTRLLALAATLTVAALVAAGCGGGSGSDGSKADYERQMRRIASDINEAIEKSDGRDNNELMRVSRQELEQGIERIEDLDPPEEVESIHEQYVKGLKDTAEVMREYEDFDPEQQEDAEETLKMFEDLDRTMAPVEQAHKDFKEAGYEVTPPPSAGAAPSEE